MFNPAFPRFVLFCFLTDHWLLSYGAWLREVLHIQTVQGNLLESIIQFVEHLLCSQHYFIDEMTCPTSCSWLVIQCIQSVLFSFRFIALNHLSCSEASLSPYFEAKYLRLGYSGVCFMFLYFSKCDFIKTCTLYMISVTFNPRLFSPPRMLFFQHGAWNVELRIYLLSAWMLSVYVRRFYEPELNVRCKFPPNSVWCTWEC